MTDNAPPAILWVPQGGQFGLGDRLRGLASGLVLARKFELPIFVQWIANAHCPYEFEDLFQVEGCQTFKGEMPDRPISPLIVLNLPLNIMPRSGHECFSTLPVATFFGNMDQFASQWQEALKTLTLQKAVLESIDDYWIPNFPKPPIGIHLRRTDNLNDRSKKVNHDNVELFDQALRAKILEIAENEPDTKFFLASDNREYAERWLADLSDAGVNVSCYTVSWSGGGLRQTSGESVVADMICLSRCRKIFNSCFSSLVFVAKSIGDNEEEHIGIQEQ